MNWIRRREKIIADWKKGDSLSITGEYYSLKKINPNYILAKRIDKTIIIILQKDDNSEDILNCFADNYRIYSLEDIYANMTNHSYAKRKVKEYINKDKDKACFLYRLFRIK